MPCQTINPATGELVQSFPDIGDDALAVAVHGAQAAYETEWQHRALFCAACGPSWAPQTLVFGMGTLNAALGQLGGEGIGLTYMTGALVKFGQGFGHWLTGTRTDLAWLVQAVMWASILLGACLATMAMRLGSSGLWPLPLLGFLLSGFATVVERFDDGIWHQGVLANMDRNGHT